MILAVEFDVSAYTDKSQAMSFVREHKDLSILINYRNFKLTEVKRSNYMSAAEPRRVWAWYGFLARYPYQQLHRIGNNILYVTKDHTKPELSFTNGDFPALYPETLRKRHKLEQSELRTERKKKENAEKRKAKKRKAAEVESSDETEEEKEYESAVKAKKAKKIKKEKKKEKKEKAEKKKKQKKSKDPLIKQEEQQLDEHLSGETDKLLKKEDESTVGAWRYNVTGIPNPVTDDLSSRLG